MMSEQAGDIRFSYTERSIPVNAFFLQEGIRINCSVDMLIDRGIQFGTTCK